DDDLEHDFPFDPQAPRLVGVFRTHFTQQVGGRDATPGPVRPAARPAARTGTDPRAGALPDPGALAAADTATSAASLALPLGGRLGQQAGAIPRVRRRGGHRGD